MKIPEGWPTEEMIRIGAHTLSEWLNDNAPIGENRYCEPAKSALLAMLEAAPEPETSEAPPRKIIRKGDVFKSTSYGWVQFKGFDYYMGQKTVMLYSSESRDTYHPLPERIEQTDSVKFVDL